MRSSAVSHGSPQLAQTQSVRSPSSRCLNKHLAFIISHHRLLRFRLRAAAAPLVPLPLPLPLLSLACDSDSGTGTDTGTPVMRSSAVSHGSPQLAHTRPFPSLSPNQRAAHVSCIAQPHARRAHAAPRTTGTWHTVHSPRTATAEIRSQRSRCARGPSVSSVGSVRSGVRYLGTKDK
jgi:hypothetical protein